MGSSLLIDPGAYDLERPRWDRAGVEAMLPHRFEVLQLSGILDVSPAEQQIVGFRRYSGDDFWVRGHVPGYPLLPGVLMIEAAAQLGTCYCAEVHPGEGFWALAGVDDVRFRGTVRPGDTVIYVCRMTRVRSRVLVFRFQGILGDKAVVQGSLMGVRVPISPG